ncbi:MAG: hypothetical protein JKP98_05650 [Rhodobacteraceae bacterium]|nr:hypothetical protein [Paracoccaceae bacterium]
MAVQTCLMGSMVPTLFGGAGDDTMFGGAGRRPVGWR